MRIVNYELLADISQYSSSAAPWSSTVTKKDPCQKQSDQALEGISITLPDVFVVEGASYHLVARS